MWPLYGSLVAGDALTTALVTHRLPVSPLAHRRCRRVRHLCYVATHNSCDPSVRSGQRKGGALLVELSPSLRASPQDGRLFPTTKDWNVSKDRNLGKPPYLFSLSFPHSDILVCGSSLALLVFLQRWSLSVSSVITRPAVYVEKASSFQLCSSPRFLIAGLTDSKWRWGFGQLLGWQIKLITDESH